MPGSKKGTKKGGIDFKKGYDPRRNYAGRPKMCANINEIRKIKLDDFVVTIDKYLKYTAKELSAAMKHPDTPALDLMVLGIIRDSIKRGDGVRMELLLTRLVGPVKKEISIEGDVNYYPALVEKIRESKKKR